MGQMFNSIIFDYDGVIADSLDKVTDRWQKCADVYGNGKKLTKEFVKSSHTGNWRKFYMDEMGVPKDKLDATSVIFKKTAEEQGPSKAFPGIKEILVELGKRYNLYVISANFSSIIRKDLENQGLLKYFKNVAGSEEVGNISKPDPQFLLSIFRKWKILPSNAVYLGDTVDEVMCGKGAGVKTIGCTWGYQSTELIVQSKPDAVASEPGEITPIVNKLFNSN